VAFQEADGAFHSKTYGPFRDGRAVTPLVLLALWAAPEQRGLDAAYRRGVDFLAAAGADPQAYPVYTLSTTLLALGSPRNDRHAAVREPLAAALRARQKEDGGWSYFDEPSNLSSALFAIGALRLAGAAADDPALVRARGFVERCQNFAAGEGAPDARFDDGGFFHSPDLPDGNKAGAAGTDAAGRPRFRSYGSMTADGVRALLRLGAAPTDPRVVAARRWLVAHFSADRNPGEFPARDEVRGASSYYYWVWSAAHAMRALGRQPGQELGKGAWAEPLADTLLVKQAEDGAWRNPTTEMREDDPLVATPFAMAALSVARTVISGELRSHAADAHR